MPRIAILGATGTIGSCLARRLVASGRELVLLGRDPAKLGPLGRELQQPSAVFNPASSASLEEALATAAAGDSYAGLVNCIGSVLLKPVHGTSDDEFRQTVETNLFTAFATVRAAGRLLRGAGGSVVLFASAAAEVGVQNHEAIAAAKAGVIGPGLVKTELTRRIWENPASAKASTDLHALGRLGEPEQIASLAQWLLDPVNDWITGQVIGVDGGLGHVLPRRTG
jgi:3-oxoacyl-[acyl-carrier protein] reductase